MDSFPYYKGSSTKNSGTLPSLEQSRAVRPNPTTYIPDDGLKAAVNVALMLGRPLLLTGEPGCGKTQLAYHLALEMKELEEPLRFDTKSTSTARDLFYTYDAVAHFHAAQINKELEPDKSKDIKEEKGLPSYPPKSSGQFEAKQNHRAQNPVRV
ncbi:MoxR family ATPase [Candidatus Venteria ishoeyi]|nr:hypothetical protein [Candidatus Venteria ishoeyi]